jgi:hypothetical protein
VGSANGRALGGLRGPRPLLGFAARASERPVEGRQAFIECAFLRRGAGALPRRRRRRQATRVRVGVVVVVVVVLVLVLVVVVVVVVVVDENVLPLAFAAGGVPLRRGEPLGVVLTRFHARIVLRVLCVAVLPRRGRRNDESGCGLEVRVAAEPCGRPASPVHHGAPADELLAQEVDLAHGEQRPQRGQPARNVAHVDGGGGGGGLRAAEGRVREVEVAQPGAELIVQEPRVARGVHGGHARSVPAGGRRAERPGARAVGDEPLQRALHSVRDPTPPAPGPFFWGGGTVRPPNRANTHTHTRTRTGTQNQFRPAAMTSYRTPSGASVW